MKIRIGLLLAIVAFSQGWAGDDEEMNDFIGGVYRGGGHTSEGSAKTHRVKVRE